ncbi:MAG: SET domain-containing protein, partial [Rhodospirillales bacterium]
MKKLSKKFKVFRSSAGLGLRALRDFKKSEELIEYTGPRLSTKKADAKPNRYLFQLNDKHYIDGSPHSNLARYINHSCRPNAKAYVSHDEKRITIEAIKRIKAGEEITY